MSSNADVENEGINGSVPPAVPDKLASGESRDASPVDASLPAVKKASKKYDKGIDHVLKALSSLESPEEKLAALCKKYADQLEEQRVTQTLVKQTQRKLQVATREKDQLQNEHSKAVLAKSKLEGLCRELQKHSKTVKDESVARARGEEEKRKEVSAKFQVTISEIQTQMEENHERNGKLREENAELADRLKKVIEQYELREQHVDKMLQHKDIERQLAEAKLKQAELQGKEQMELWLQEKQVLLKNLTDCHCRMEEYERSELTMKAQITIYNQKYEEFQGTLTKSSEVFNTWKGDMDTMSKRIKKLEKETRTWRTRWENTNRALIEMVDQKTTQDDVTRKVQVRCSQLEKLCRAMQSERKGDSKVEDQIADILAERVLPAAPLAAAPTKASSPALDEQDRGRARTRGKPATNGVQPVAQPAPVQDVKSSVAEAHAETINSAGNNAVPTCDTSSTSDATPANDARPANETTPASETNAAGDATPASDATLAKDTVLSNDPNPASDIVAENVTALADDAVTNPSSDITVPTSAQGSVEVLASRATESDCDSSRLASDVATDGESPDSAADAASEQQLGTDVASHMSQPDQKLESRCEGAESMAAGGVDASSPLKDAEDCSGPSDARPAIHQSDAAENSNLPTA